MINFEQLKEELSKPRTYVHPKYFLPKLKVRAINKSKYEELPRFFYQKYIFISYVKIGKLLNYPPCCIKSFNLTNGLLSFSDAEKRRYESSTLDGTGYIPCLKCRQKEASYLLARINKKRNKKIGKLKPYFKKVKITPYTRLVAI